MARVSLDFVFGVAWQTLEPLGKLLWVLRNEFEQGLDMFTGSVRAMRAIVLVEVAGACASAYEEPFLGIEFDDGFVSGFRVAFGRDMGFVAEVAQHGLRMADGDESGCTVWVGIASSCVLGHGCC